MAKSLAVMAETNAKYPVLEQQDKFGRSRMAAQQSAWIGPPTALPSPARPGLGGGSGEIF